MIRIVADTTCALPKAVTEKLGIPVLPQFIIFGEESFRDDTQLNTAQFLAKLRASSDLPQTSAPPPALYAPIFKEILDRGDSVLVLSPSEDVSGTYRGAVVAAEDFPGAAIQVIDTRTIAGNLGETVILADKWAKAGASLKEIVQKVKSLQDSYRTYFVVDTLEFLRRGGRIGTAKALLGEMLQVKPILRLQDGHVGPFEQQRTRSRALGRLSELVLTECPRSKDAHLCVMHADAPDTAADLAAMFGNQMGLGTVPVYEVPPAIVVHAGPGVVAAGFFTEPVT